MKVAYLLNQYPYASCTFIRREIFGLESAGVEVQRISIREPELEIADESDLRERDQTRTILDVGAPGLLWSTLVIGFTRPSKFIQTALACIRLGWRSDRGIPVHLVYLAEACVLARWFAADPVEHLHSHFGTNSTSVAMFCRQLGGPPYSFTVHGPGEFDQPKPLYLKEKVANAAFVVAITSFARGQLFRWCDVDDRDKIHIVHCGVDDAFLSPPEVPMPKERRAVCVGRLGEQKGHHILIEAAGLLAQEDLDFQIALVGDGELRPQIEQLIAELNLEDRVILTGWADDTQVREQVLGSQIFVLSSFAEGLPVVIMEALALSRPVITTWIAGVPELVEDGKCGWLVPSGSVVAMAEAMREAFSTPPERLEEMGRYGREKVLREHDADLEAKKLADLIERYSAAG